MHASDLLHEAANLGARGRQCLRGEERPHVFFVRKLDARELEIFMHIRKGELTLPLKNVSEG